MSFREDSIVLSFPKVDSGNTGANVAAIVAPCRLIVKRLVCASVTSSSNSYTISVDSLSNGTQGAEDIGKIIVPDAAAAGKGYFDEAGSGVVLKAGDVVLLQLDEAGEGGKFASVSIHCEYKPEVDGNETNLTLTA